MNLLIGGSLGDRDVHLTVAAKEMTESNVPVGAALIAQAMDRREGAGRYKAMQSIVDWDRSRLAYRAVKRAFDIVWLFGGFCGRDSGIGPAQRAKTTIWN